MSPSLPSLQTLISQFQNRYPMGSLISEFLTVHEGQYAVRALVQVGGTVIATGMAVAANIEQAEDRAKMRALESLGGWLTAAASAPSLVNPPTLESLQSVQEQNNLGEFLPSPLAISGDQSVRNQSAIASSFVPEAIAPIKAAPIESITPSPVAPKRDIPKAVVADLYSHINLDDDFSPSHSQEETPESEFSESSSGSNVYSPPEEMPDFSGLPPLPNGKTTRSKSKPQPDQNLSTAATDLSDVIAQTDVELARLGWGKTQGREHLKRTYGKRSRQELDETELYDFLHHLESL